MNVNDAEARLADFVQGRPFEFTFVRDPVGHVISGAAELLSCARRVGCVPFSSSVCPQALTNASAVLALFDFALRNVTLSDRALGRTVDICARHLWPCVAASRSHRHFEACTGCRSAESLPAWWYAGRARATHLRRADSHASTLSGVWSTLTRTGPKPRLRSTASTQSERVACACGGLRIQPSSSPHTQAALQAVLLARAEGKPPPKDRPTQWESNAAAHTRRHSQKLSKGGAGYAALEEHPFVRHALGWDRECLWRKAGAWKSD